MELFYSTEILGSHIILGEEESRHCIKVLRKTLGDNLSVIDGRGNLYEGVLEIDGKNKAAKVRINSKKAFEASIFQSGFHLAIAPTKSTERMEWLVEKTVELGIASITFLQCERSERTKLRLDRLEKIAVAALKQSQQYWMPQIILPISFKSYLEQFTPNGKGFIAHCHEGEKAEFKSGLIKNPCHVLIGPEGDFSEKEVQLALGCGLNPISLGLSRLRTETAGLYACGVYRSFNSK